MSRSLSTVLMILLVIILAGGAGLGAYYYQVNRLAFVQNDSQAATQQLQRQVEVAKEQLADEEKAKTDGNNYEFRVECIKGTEGPESLCENQVIAKYKKTGEEKIAIASVIKAVTEKSYFIYAFANGESPVVPVSPDGKYIYLARYDGINEKDGQRPITFIDAIFRYDLATGKGEKLNISGFLGDSEENLMMSADSSKILDLQKSEGNKTLRLLNIFEDKATIIAQLQEPRETFGFYCGNNTQTTLSFVDDKNITAGVYTLPTSIASVCSDGEWLKDPVVSRTEKIDLTKIVK